MKSHFISLESGQSYALRGFESANPPELHACCHPANEAPFFWRVELLDYSNNTKHEFANVQQIGNGDNVSLTPEWSEWVVKPSASEEANELPSLEFDTNILKVDEDAKKHVEK
ncbi:hypothetical protein HDU76_008091 [Blyttiomyces sp. JEL0837]|nr:hypothetical protein HDU76_008091 [Blyttiomyces sp. JEL0837]